MLLMVLLQLVAVLVLLMRIGLLLLPVLRVNLFQILLSLLLLIVMLQVLLHLLLLVLSFLKLRAFLLLPVLIMLLILLVILSEICLSNFLLGSARQQARREAPLVGGCGLPQGECRPAANLVFLLRGCYPQNSAPLPT